MNYFRIIFRTGIVAAVAMATPLVSAQQGSVTTSGTGTAGVQIESFAAYPDVVAKTGNDTTSAFRVFNHSNAELLRVSASGNIGIGTTTPSARLMLRNTTIGTWGLVSEQRSNFTTNATAYDVAATFQSYPLISAGVTNSGSALGASGLSYLQGAGTLATAYGLMGEASVLVGQTGTITNAYGVYARVAKNNGVITNGYGIYIPDVTATNDLGIVQIGVDDGNYFGGEIQVGPVLPVGTPFTTKLTVNGNVVVAGSITGASVIGATFQDVAEWVPATTDMEPGTVVVLNGERSNEVMPSHRSYDTTVAGVVSAAPGIILGVGSETKEQIATTGRVKVRVDATHAPVRIGDLLVTSDTAGAAMRSEPMDLNGRKFHQPGTIIGKALEALEGGTGEILVLLSLQ